MRCFYCKKSFLNETMEQMLSLYSSLLSKMKWGNDNYYWGLEMIKPYIFGNENKPLVFVYEKKILLLNVCDKHPITSKILEFFSLFFDKENIGKDLNNYRKKNKNLIPYAKVMVSNLAFYYLENKDNKTLEKIINLLCDFIKIKNVYCIMPESFDLISSSDSDSENEEENENEEDSEKGDEEDREEENEKENEKASDEDDEYRLSFEGSILASSEYVEEKEEKEEDEEDEEEFKFKHRKYGGFVDDDDDNDLFL